MILKLRVVSSNSEIEALKENEQMVHLIFRASNADVVRLVQNCPQIKAVSVPSIHRKFLSKSSELFLMMQGVELIEGDVWGHRKDINEYYTIDDVVLRKIGWLRAKGANEKEIVNAVSQETQLSPELVKYLIKEYS